MAISTLPTRPARSGVLAEARFGNREPLARLAIACLAVFLVLVAGFSLAIGPLDIDLSREIGALFGNASAEAADALRDSVILWQVRLPRVLLGALVGAALAVSGAMMQGLFRNPLADPGIVGVSAGAGLGAASMIVLGGTALAPLYLLLGIYALPLAAFFGGLLTTFVLYRIGTRGGFTSVATMLLAGIALAALAGAATGLLVYVADDQQLRDLNFWLLGSLAGSTWQKLAAVAPIIGIVLLTIPVFANGLNGLVLGEAAAGHLGVRVQRLKIVCIVAVAAATGASVAVSGGIGFVGIVVPHLLRLSIGPDHRHLLPASALLGASLLILADTVSRTIVSPAELPIGIVTAIAGAPVFLWILLGRKGLTQA
ncbi:FecCD family ABC transporter permease [Stappia sp.]|jgi:iron complex transport system permease protein|uniref:FecCD family ABC transporter permease n=1 Tax=Stappia sp. TaxID=1870903 RepID=UPI003A99E0AF